MFLEADISRRFETETEDNLFEESQGKISRLGLNDFAVPQIS